jgi:hypothetical protein
MSDDGYGDDSESAGYDASGGYTEDGGDAPTGSDQVFYAVCQDPHGLQGEWYGPNRASSAEAHTDADHHVSQYPGHTPAVIPY